MDNFFVRCSWSDLPEGESRRAGFDEESADFGGRREVEGFLTPCPTDGCEKQQTVVSTWSSKARSAWLSAKTSTASAEISSCCGLGADTLLSDSWNRGRFLSATPKSRLLLLLKETVPCSSCC